MDIYEKIIEFLSNDTRILSISILGSYNKGTNRKESDIDIALLLPYGEKITGIEKFNYIKELTYILGIKVDIGIINKNNLIYSREALLNGNTIYIRDREKFNDLRANLLCLYITYCDDVREVLNAYRA